MAELKTQERELLTMLQKEFPITEAPFDVLAERLGRDPDETVEMVQGFKERGLIRRLGGILSTKRLGFSSTLAAIKVPEERLGEVAGLINQYRGVTHNYLRAHSVNLWFTMIAETPELVETYLQEIEEITGLTVLRMPTLKRFKLGVKLKMNKRKQKKEKTAAQNSTRSGRDADLAKRVPAPEHVEIPSNAIDPAEWRTDEAQKAIDEQIADSRPYEEISEEDRQILRRLQGNMPVTRRPFAGWAKELELTDEEFVQRIREYREKKWVRRLGAVLYHRRAGFSHNAMVGWVVPRDDVDEVGPVMASFDEISHCYERPVYPPEWPYNMYTMVHARSQDELQHVIDEIRARVGDYDYRALMSVHEFKKTSIEYF